VCLLLLLSSQNYDISLTFIVISSILRRVRLSEKAERRKMAAELCHFFRDDASILNKFAPRAPFLSSPKGSSLA